MHSPRHIDVVPLKPDIFTLAGHSHNGLVPPVMDELLKSTTREFIAPGYKITTQKSIQYELFAPNSRIRPSGDNYTMTVPPCTYLSASSHLWLFNQIYPKVSYDVIIHDDIPKLQFQSEYFCIGPSTSNRPSA